MRRTFAASQAVSDAPAIYFVKPTDENVERMAADIKKGLYRTLGARVGRSTVCMSAQRDRYPRHAAAHASSGASATLPRSVGSTAPTRVTPASGLAGLAPRRGRAEGVLRVPESAPCRRVSPQLCVEDPSRRSVAHLGYLLLGYLGVAAVSRRSSRTCIGCHVSAGRESARTEPLPRRPAERHVDMLGSAPRVVWALAIFTAVAGWPPSWASRISHRRATRQPPPVGSATLAGHVGVPRRARAAGAGGRRDGSRRARRKGAHRRVPWRTVEDRG